MKNKFKEMFELQNQLNNNTNGKEWTKGITKNDRKINWFRCIYMETGEGIDSLNWKHWKDINAVDDINNLQVEVVDVWHFIMSQMITEEGVETSIETAFNLYSQMENYLSVTNEENSIGLIDLMERMMQQSVNYELPLSTFFAIVNKLDNFDMNSVYKLYLGKNCLNEFRQNNGYKDGSYIKIWNGEEDNVYMQQFIESNPNISFSELTSKLNEIYKSL